MRLITLTDFQLCLIAIPRNRMGQFCCWCTRYGWLTVGQNVRPVWLRWFVISNTLINTCINIFTPFRLYPTLKNHENNLTRWKNEIKPDYPCPFSHSVISRWFFLFSEVFWQKKTWLRFWCESAGKYREEEKLRLRLKIDLSYVQSFIHGWAAYSSKAREERRGRFECSAKIPPGHKSAISRCVCSTSCKHTHTNSLNLLEREHGKRDDFFKEGCVQ